MNSRKLWKDSTMAYIPVLVFVIGTVILGVLGYRLRASQDSLTRSKVELNAVTYAEHIRLDIMKGLDATSTLEQVLISSDGKIQKFPQIAENMMTDYFQSIQLAPDGIVTDIYPEKGNEAGKIDLLNDKERGAISRYARDNDVITMQGPFTLKQGGSGIAIRNPVYLEREDGQRIFWGFTIVIIRVPEIFSEPINALSNFGYDYKLSKNISPWDNTYQEVYSSGAQMQDAEAYRFEMGDSHWLLEVQPVGGWNSSQTLYWTIGCGAAIILLLSGLASVLLLLRKAKKSETQTAELNKQLQSTIKQANAASRAKSEFISNMSHDIRTPMNAIIGYTAIALKQHPEQKQRSYLEKIQESSEHLLTLINDVLEISRIESGKIAIELVPANITSVEDEVLDIARGLAVGRDLRFEVHRAELTTPYVLMDVVRVREVLINVLSNAVKFTGDGGTISFAADYMAECDKHRVTVRYTVSDTGIGMSDEFQKHVFEEFAQENTSARTQYKGTGLGMAIVKHYVEMMGGSISVRSKKNVGTTYTIGLPMELADAVQTPSPEKSGVQGSLSGLHILLAEDNDLNAEIVQMLLADEKMTITRATNGAQTVELFSNSMVGTFDVILMDVMMPVMDGLRATKAIRALERPDAKTIPIVAMTANAFAEDVQECIEAGMNAHLAKPINVEALKNMLRSCTPS